MENKMSKEHVAELLKQLEELKRKKAYKERKLQKLKSVSNLKNGQASNRKRPKVEVTKESLTKENGVQLLKEKCPCDSTIPIEKDNCFTFVNSKCSNTDTPSVKVDKENFAYEKIDPLHCNDNLIDENVKSFSDVETQKLSLKNDHIEESYENPTLVIHKTISNSSFSNLLKCTPSCNDVFKSDSSQAGLKRDLTVCTTEKDSESFVPKKYKAAAFDDDYNVKCDEGKCYLSIGKLNSIEKNVHGEEIIENSICNTKEGDKSHELSHGGDALSAATNVSNKKISSPVIEKCSSHSSSKSLPISKGSSDLLDDSLNANMSCFLSCDLFDNICNEKKEINFTSVNNSEYPKNALKVSKSIVVEHKTSSIYPNPVSNASQQNNLDFNFPKFSTPTDLNFCLSSDDKSVRDLLEKMHMPKTSKSPEKESNSITNIHVLDKSLKENISSQNKFSPSKINCILGKGLSSVLDAQFESPKKSASNDRKFSSALNAKFVSPKKPTSNYRISYSACDNEVHSQNVTTEAVVKKRKLFRINSCGTYSEPEQIIKRNDKFVPQLILHKTSENFNSSVKNTIDASKQMDYDYLDFVNVDDFGSNSDSFSDLQNTSDVVVNLACDSDDILSEVNKTMDGLVNRVCENFSTIKSITTVPELCPTSIENDNLKGDNIKLDSEILVIPETEGLGLYFSRDSEEFLETSTLSQNMKDFQAENLLDMSSQSKLESPVVNNILASVKLSKTLLNSQAEYNKLCYEKENGTDLCNKSDCNQLLNERKNDIHLSNEPSEYNKLHNEKENYIDLCNKCPEKEKLSSDNISAFDNSLGLDTSFLEDDTQTLGHFKKVPYMNEINVQQNSAEKNNVKEESNLNFICSLYGAQEPVIDVEIAAFSGVNYAFIHQATQIHIWRQEKNRGWIKIFSHHVEDMLSLVQICVSMDEDNLVIVMLLSGEEKYCLQFLLFEKDTRVIKLMENTHWLEDSDFRGSILLCGLNGLMFATAQNKKNPEVSLHAFISLKENPRLMSANLGSTDTTLCSLCKIDKLPNALMGVNDSKLYVWHILEARLVTAVALHPCDYLPIKQCFWATVENGLIYFLSTCEGKENHQVCQLLAANLATGFCQSAMTYSTRPSNYEVVKITKAAYLEPFLVVAHSNGAFLWSVMEEFCCAALSSKSNITTTAISKDFENWGLLVLGSKSGNIDCYSIH